MVGREWHTDPAEVFWRWPICKCHTLMHVYFYANNVTCEAPLDSAAVIDEIAILYANDH